MQNHFNKGSKILVALFMALMMTMSTTTTSELMNAVSHANTSSSTTEQIPFSESIIHQSRENIFDEVVAQWGAGGSITGNIDDEACQYIKTNFWSSWDCSDKELADGTSGTWTGNDGGWDCYNGCYMEHEKYTIELDIVYEYMFDYSGTITLDTTTSWSSTGQPTTTVELTNSYENIDTYVRAFFDLSIKRYFDDSSLGSPSVSVLRQVVFNHQFPFISPNDVDGGGGRFYVSGVGYFYEWDQYVEIDSFSKSNGLGQKYDLDGYVSLASIDLIEVAAKYFENSGLYQYSRPLKAINYVISLDLSLTLNFEVDMVNRAQLFLGMSTPNQLGYTYHSEGIRDAYNCRLPADGSTMSGSASSQSCSKVVGGSGEDLNGRLGFRNWVKTKEYYSVDLILKPGNGRYADDIWDLFTTRNSIQFPLVVDNRYTTSTDFHHTLTSSSVFIASTPSPATSNNAPTMTISHSGGSAPITANVGDTIQISALASDADGDTLSKSISWGDGTQTTLATSGSHSYSTPGSYQIVAYATDGIETTYSNAITVIITPETSSLDSISISADNVVINEGESITFTMASSNPGASFNFVFSDGYLGTTNLQTTNGELIQVTETVTYGMAGTYRPSVTVYDDAWNFVGMDQTSIQVNPNLGNGTIDSSTFQILGDEILVVIDDSGSELQANRSSFYDADTYNSNNSKEALVHALRTVSNIRDVDMDILTVGDTNFDGRVDNPNADGPGLLVLQQYSTVIWTTGKVYSPLSERDESVLRTFTEAGGSLILFSQDYLWGAGAGLTNWTQGSFAHDILGVASNIHDVGEPSSGTLQASDGEGMYNLEYFPLAGLGDIRVDYLNSSSYQDHISKDMYVQQYPEIHTFESSSIHSSKSVFMDSQGNSYGQGTVNWRSWSYWARDCSTYGPNSVVGSCSAKSASATHNNMKQILADIPSSSEFTTISFDVKVSSEPTHDYLAFSVDGTEVQRWSGNTGWRSFTHTLTPGYHSLQWAYVKDGSVSQGSDAAWIDNVRLCCGTEVTETGYTAEILTDGEHNYGLVNMINEGGRVVFISLDPVQVSSKYDLETMMLQLVDWAEGDFVFGTKSEANYVPVGVDGLRPAQSYGSTENWFKVRLFQGQRIQIQADMSAYSGDFAISQLDVENPRGIVSQGNQDQDQLDKWELIYEATESGTHYIMVDIDKVGSTTDVNPWYGFSIELLEDLNTISYGKYQPLFMDDPTPHKDTLSPIGWNDYNFDFEYSTNSYYLGEFDLGDTFGITITSTEDYLSQDVVFGFTDYVLAQKLLNQSENGDLDNDGDGLADDVDTDDDDDGILDQFDPSPLDADDDGIPNKDDDDDDGNGILDEDEVWLGSDEFNLPAQETRRGIFWIEDSTPKELGMFFANIKTGTHPLETTFEYEIELWSLPDADLSEGSVFELTEDVDYEFWFANIDTSDNFTIELATDEAMELQFSSSDVIYENSTFANYTCLTSGEEFSVELTNNSEVLLECSVPFDVIELEMSTRMTFAEYSLRIERVEPQVFLEEGIPSYGISQSTQTNDQWLIQESVHDQILHVFADLEATISIYDATGIVSTNVVGQAYNQVQDDIDSDGWSDSWEVACLSSQNDVNEQPVDSDQDGICDYLDAFPYDASMNQVITSIILPASSSWFEITDTEKYGLLLANPSAPQFSVDTIEYTGGDQISITLIVDHSLLLTAIEKSEYSGYDFDIINPALNVNSLMISGSDITGIYSTESYGENFVNSGTKLFATFSITADEAVNGMISGTIIVDSSWSDLDHEFAFDVTVNSAPIIDGPDKVTLDILDDATIWQYTATDVDGDNLEFIIESDQSDVQINTDTGVVSWKATVAGEYILTVIVSDGIFEDRMTVDITVNQLALPPTVYGCMDSTAINYNPEATESDSSCTYSEPVDDVGDDVVDDVVDDDSDQELPNNQGDVDKDSTANDEKSSESTTKMAMQIIAIIGLILLVVLLTLAFTRSKHQELIEDEFGYENVSLEEYGQINTYPVENQTTEVRNPPIVQPPPLGPPPSQLIVEESSEITEHYELDGRAVSPTDTAISSVEPQRVDFSPPGHHENQNPPVEQVAQNEAPKASERVGFAPPGYHENRSPPVEQATQSTAPKASERVGFAPPGYHEKRN